MPIIQSTADTQPLPPTASEAPTDDEIAINLKTADQSQTDISQPSAEALLNQFQAWTENARAQIRPYSPYRIPKHTSCKLPQNRSGPCKRATAQARAKSKDREKCPSKSCEKCTSTGPARAECPGTGSVRAKCPGTEVEARAKHRSAQLDLAGSDAVSCQARGISAQRPLEQSGSRVIVEGSDHS